MQDPDDEWAHAPLSHFDEWRKLYRCWFTLDEKQAMERRRVQQQEHDALLLINKLHEAGVHFMLWHESLEVGVHYFDSTTSRDNSCGLIYVCFSDI